MLDLVAFLISVAFIFLLFAGGGFLIEGLNSMQKKSYMRYSWDPTKRNK